METLQSTEMYFKQVHNKAVARKQFSKLVQEFVLWTYLNLLYYEYWTEKQKYFYVYQNALWWNHSSQDTETRENYD